MDVNVGDILLMKKQHPCGGKRVEVLRILKYAVSRAAGKGWFLAVRRSEI